MSFTEHQLKLRYDAGLSTKQLKFAHTQCFGGDPQAPPANETMYSVLDAYAHQLPKIMNATGKAIGPFEQQLQDAQSQILPQQEALQTQLYQQYAPTLNSVGQQLNASNALAQNASDAAVVGSPQSQQLISQSLANQMQADPNFYPTQNRVAQGYSNLLGAQDPTKLSGSEAATVERGLNRLNFQGGNATTGAPLNTLNAGMTFGNALANKQAAYGQTLGLGANMLPTMKSGIDTFQLTTGRPSMNNQGAQGQFLGVNPNSFGQQGLGMANNVFNGSMQAGLQANDINANRRDTLDRFNQTAVAQSSAVGNVTGGGCCFIFLEAYNGLLPSYVRQARDIAYTRRPSVGKGYKWMAKWLVPIMCKSSIVTNLVNELMVKPLSEHAAYISGCRNVKPRSGYYGFWFTVWNFLGK